MIDKDLLFMFTESVDNFRKYKKFVKPHVIEKETSILINYIDDYYTAHPGETSINWAAFSSFFSGDLSKRLTVESYTLIRALAKSMEVYKPSTAYDKVVKDLIELDYIARLMEELDKVKSGSSDLEHVHTLATNALKDIERYIDHEDLFVVPDISSVVDRITSTGYEWRLNSLNRSLGLVRPGDFLIVAARVEVGKTTFLASEASYLATQLPDDRPVVWVNNEEKSDTVFFRVVQAALGKTTKDILADSKTAMDDYTKLMRGNANKILVTDGNTNHVNALDVMFKDVNPEIGRAHV